MSLSTILNRNNVHIEGEESARQWLIFAHGFGTDQTAWNRVKGAFASDYKILLYDNVGAGKSDINAYSSIKYKHLHAYADDLLQICDHLSIKDAIYIGHSVSCTVGLLAAVKSPEVFSKMVLIGGSPRYLNDGNYIGGFTQDELDKLYQQMIAGYQQWAAGFSRLAMRNEQNPSLSEELACTLSAIRPDIAVDVARTIFESDYRAILPEVNKEILLIQSKRDLVVPLETARYLHSSLKHSTLVHIEAEGHFPHISAPDEVIREIKTYLSYSHAGN